MTFNRRHAAVLVLVVGSIAGGLLAWRFNLVPEIGRFFAAEVGQTCNPQQSNPCGRSNVECQETTPGREDTERATCNEGLSGSDGFEDHIRKCPPSRNRAYIVNAHCGDYIAGVLRDFCEYTYRYPGEYTCVETGASLPPLTVDIKCNGQDSCTVEAGTIHTITWISSGASSCTGTLGAMGLINRAGASYTSVEGVWPWTITCTGPEGEVSDSLEVTVVAGGGAGGAGAGAGAGACTTPTCATGDNDCDCFLPLEAPYCANDCNNQDPNVAPGTCPTFREQFDLQCGRQVVGGQTGGARGAPVNNIPIGSNDGYTAAAQTLEGGTGTIPANSVFGWAFDPDQPATSIDVHVYFDAGPGCPDDCFGGAVTTNLERVDVNRAYGIEGNHGFALSVPQRYHDGREHTAYLFGIDSSGDGNFNAFIAARNFTIAAPAAVTTTVAPTPAPFINGYKSGGAGETVTLDGGSPTTDDPYAFNNVSPGNHTVAVTVPAGWTVGYTLCYDSTSCHGQTPEMASAVTVTVPVTGFVDLYWHYFPPEVTVALPATTAEETTTGGGGITATAVRGGGTTTESTTSVATPGDVDGNSAVNIFDYNILVSNFGESGMTRSGGDLDGDGDVDIFDYTILVGNFGE